MEIAAEKGRRRSSRGRKGRIDIGGVGGAGGLLVLGGGLLAATLGIGVTACVFGRKKRHEEQSKEKGIEGGKEVGGHPSVYHLQRPLSPSPSDSSHNSRETDDYVKAAPSAGHEDTLIEDKEQPPTLPHSPVDTDNHTVLRTQDMDINIDISVTTGDVIAVDESKVAEENISSDEDVKEKQVVADEDVNKEEESLEEDQDEHIQDKCVEERLLGANEDEDEGSPEEENRESLSDREMKEKVVDEDEGKVEGLPEEKQSEHECAKLANEDNVKEERSPEEEGESEQVSDSTENTSVESDATTELSSSSSLEEEYGMKSVFDIMTAIKDDRNEAKNDAEPMHTKMAKEANAVTNYRVNLPLALALLLAIIFLLRVVETYQNLRGDSSLLTTSS